MRMLRFGTEKPKQQVTRFDSVGVFTSLLGRVPSQAQLVCLHVQPNGIVGRHPATGQQLFVVVEGGGWVSGRDEESLPIEPGFAALWESGEEHESRAGERGMTALVIEAIDLGLSGLDDDPEVL